MSSKSYTSKSSWTPLYQTSKTNSSLSVQTKTHNDSESVLDSAEYKGLPSNAIINNIQTSLNSGNYPTPPTPIQPKLTVGAVGDPYEQEADSMAAKVMSMSDSAPQVQRFEEGNNPLQMKSLAQSITPVVQRQVNPQLQMSQLVQRAFQGGENQASGDLESRLDASKGGGSPLDANVRSFMEPRFGADFSQVRVHTGGEAVQMSQELGAQAFTHGSDVYFGEGKSPGSNELTAHELTHVVQQTGVLQREPNVITTEKQTQKPASVEKQTLPSANELTTRIARCIGIWETNRGKDNPNPKESSLDTVAGVHASMATIEQATMPYAIDAFKKSEKLRGSANPPLKMTEINAAEARCRAVVTLLDLVNQASAKGKDVDTFIKDNAVSILATGLSNNDVKTMFSAVTLKGQIKTSRGSIEQKMQQFNEKRQKMQQKLKNKDLPKEERKSIQNELKKTPQQAKKEYIDNAIPEKDRLGLGLGSLKTYMDKPETWGENRAGWQRKAVGLMADNVGKRIESVSVSNNGAALAIPVIQGRVNVQLAKKPVPTEAEIVKTVAQQNNPGEKSYGDNVWKTYHRLYP